MPFTPFHIGPGTAIKAVAGKQFSLTVFGFTQIIIDIEPLVRMLQHDVILHGYTHTYMGALIIGSFCFFTGKPVCEYLLRLWNFLIHLQFLQLPISISRTAAVTGAFIGSFSHVLLDSFMHADMHPLVPFSNANGLLYFFPVGLIYLFCIASAVFGVFVIFLMALWKIWAIDID